MNPRPAALAFFGASGPEFFCYAFFALFCERVQEERPGGMIIGAAAILSMCF